MSKKAKFRIEYEVEVKNKKGEIIHKEKKECKSLLKNFMLWLHSKFTMDTDFEPADTWSALDITNTSRSFPYASGLEEEYFGAFGALAAAEDRGIRVGTSDTSVSPNDYELKNKIDHGTGSGQMLYGLQTFEAVEVVGDDSRFRITRTFTNNSGAIITVKEIGAAFSMGDTAQTRRHLLYLRDVLVSPSSVPDAATLTVRYRFIVTA